jgi:hypothetical protein
MDSSVKLDKELYKKAYEGYRQWNIAEQVDRLYQARSRPAGEGWKQYQALVEFLWELRPHQSPWQRDEKLASLSLYYERVQKLEVWRREHGKTA